MRARERVSRVVEGGASHTYLIYIFFHIKKTPQLTREQIIQLEPSPTTKGNRKRTKKRRKNLHNIIHFKKIAER